MKIPELKRSGTGLIAEFCRIPNGFSNQGRCMRAEMPSTWRADLPSYFRQEKYLTKNGGQICPGAEKHLLRVGWRNFSPLS
jgi:hypothetical protein